MRPTLYQAPRRLEDERRRTWAVSQMMRAHPELTRSDVEALYDRVAGRVEPRSAVPAPPDAKVGPINGVIAIVREVGRERRHRLSPYDPGLVLAALGIVLATVGFIHVTIMGDAARQVERRSIASSEITGILVPPP